MHKQHDRHGGELLGEGRQAKIGVCVDGLPRPEIADAVAVLK
jgi:hypothetical protein